jgi:hypothetical protein
MDWKKGCISVINYAKMKTMKLACNLPQKDALHNLSGKMQGVRQGPPGAPRVLNSGVD